MCPPTYFAVRYRINPWMRTDHPVNRARAVVQWGRLHAQLLALGHQVRLVPPVPLLPDMVFAANGGIVIGDRALVPRFKHRERAGESAYFARAFAELGLAEVGWAESCNEGEGDFLLAGDRILAGSGFRSDRRAAGEVAEFFGLPVVPLSLVDPRFYHLDTALAVLRGDLAVYWPGAFDRRSRAVLRELFPDAVLAQESDAAALGLNMLSDTRTVVMSPDCGQLSRRIAERGLQIVTVETDELRKAGGGAKCCVLEHHDADGQGASARAAG
jgi:N-dimethylarginine dimethylaminohydrolase